MSLVERSKSQDVGIVAQLTRSTRRLLELSPFYSKKKEEEFTNLVKSTIAKLLKDLQSGGFCEFPDDDMERLYHVDLKGVNGQRYWVYLDYGLKTFQENSRDVSIHASDLSDGASSPRHFVLSFSGERDRPFFGPNWLGVSYFCIDRHGPSGQKKPRFTSEEKYEFLQELIAASIDEEETHRRFDNLEQEYEKEKQDWSVRWARDVDPNLFLQ